MSNLLKPKNYEVVIYEHSGFHSKPLDNILVGTLTIAEKLVAKLKVQYSHNYIFVRQFYEKSGRRSFRVLHTLTYDGSRREKVG